MHLMLLRQNSYVPFVDLLAYQIPKSQTSIRPPQYVAAPDFRFHLRCLVNDDLEFLVPLLHFPDTKTPESTPSSP